MVSVTTLVLFALCAAIPVAQSGAYPHYGYGVHGYYNGGNGGNGYYYLNNGYYQGRRPGFNQGGRGGSYFRNAGYDGYYRNGGGGGRYNRRYYDGYSGGY